MESETITILAEQLGLVASNVFNIFTTAQPTLGCISAFLLIALIIGTLLVYKHVCKLTVDNQDKWEIRFIATACSGLVLVLISCIVYDIIACIMLPEYAAATELIGLLAP